MKKQNLFALPGEDYPIIPEEKLFEVMNTQVLPVLDGLRRSFTITESGGHSIYGEVFPMKDNTRGSILISHGCTESRDKYRELIWYFLQEGYQVCILDHRGHGDSRDCMPSTGTTHVERFQHYVDDLALVVDQELRKLPKPYILYAHSMGGLIGAMYLEQYPGVFSKAVLNAPMFEINRSGLPYWMAKLAAGAMCLLGKGEDYLPGQGKFRPEEDFENAACTSRERYRFYFQRQMESPSLQSNGSSCRWARESFRAGERGRHASNASKITIPVLLFQAERDDYVLPGGQETFMSSVPKGRTVFVPGGKHELYLSDDKIQCRYMRVLMDFINE